ncbi:BlaI/MecI/CopY family transcriptional regulator [Caulobacter sp. NIBR2454]|uniref:BlaI/MecI/CopY family transcriptional regulator n=1 Tax=Caulobacter sp. NIBR2454 TaxID=3015996 RepID=UPI0022B704F6|nr:BlaI/MecI/CopY family transcriptional regulator [Caulobacter sp. NIBR2454]
MEIAVTPAESEVLAVLWRRGPLPFATLIEAVKAGRPWADSTIKTLLSRLIQKGALEIVRESGRQRYRPLISREAYVESEIQALADRLFGGDRPALVQHLIEAGLSGPVRPPPGSRRP